MVRVGAWLRRGMTAAGAAVLLLGAGAAQARIDLSAAKVEPWADRLLGGAYAQGRVSGISIVVVQDGKVTFEKSYGYADWKQKRPIDPALTRFRVASLSKTFTALAVAQLVERGQIKSLDDPANRYLLRAQLPKWRGRDITVWNLLNHRGGLRQKHWMYEPVSRPLSKADIALNAPGQDPQSSDGADYCDYCSGILGVLVEDVTGEPLPAYLDREVLRPMGMTGSIMNGSRSPSANVGRGYNIEPGAGGTLFKYVVVPEFYAPAGTIEATPDDMGRYMIAMLGGQGSQVIKPETRSLMLTPHYRNHPAASGFGMIWMGQTWNGETVREHGGLIDGYNTILSLFPDSNGGVFISDFSGLIAGEPKVGGFYGLTGFNYREMFYRRFLGVEPFKPIATPADLHQYEGVYVTNRRDVSWPIRLGDLLGGPTTKVEAVRDGLMIGGMGPYRAAAPDVFRFPGVNGDDPYIPFPNRETFFFLRGADGKVANYTQTLALHTARPQTFSEKQATQRTIAGIGLLSLLGLGAVFWRLPGTRVARLLRWSVIGTAVVGPATLGLTLTAFARNWLGGMTTHPWQWSDIAVPLGVGAVLTGVLALATAIAAIALWQGFGATGRWTRLNAALAAIGGLALTLLFYLDR
jgi:CubicO group peptidase (beta-lactamase class C family)